MKALKQKLVQFDVEMTNSTKPEAFEYSRINWYGGTVKYQEHKLTVSELFNEKPYYLSDEGRSKLVVELELYEESVLPILHFVSTSKIAQQNFYTNQQTFQELIVLIHNLYKEEMECE